MKTRRLPAWLILWITLTSALIGTKVRGETNQVTGYLYGNHNWVATNTYILTGFTYVMSNAVLNIVDQCSQRLRLLVCLRWWQAQRQRHGGPSDYLHGGGR